MFLVLIIYADKGSSSKEDMCIEGICVAMTAGERSVFCAKCYLFQIFLVLDLCSSKLVFQRISCFTISQLFFVSNECQ